MDNDLYLKELWKSSLVEVQKKINKTSFENLFKSTRPLTMDEDNIYIGVPNIFTKRWVESRFFPLIEEAIKNNSKKNYSVQFSVIPSFMEKNTSKKNNFPDNTFLSKSNLIKQKKPFLNPKYTFESFVIGENNRFSYAASMAVSESPAKAYNPLFIYGGVGLGKTHLLHAIGHFISENNFNSNVLYISSEIFTNDFINSIVSNKTPDFRSKFRDKYRKNDVLLIDDIQFLAGKEQTQEEFFHTFNALHENNKQIIISSDRPPKDIPTLEERLRSRFEWGLITDIQPPDLETRIAILRKKSLLENLEIPDDIIYYIANNINTNIRELEGAFIRVIAHFSLSKSNITDKDFSIEHAKEALKDIIQNKKNKKYINLKLIKEITSDYFNVDIKDLIGKKRTRAISLPRQVAMYISRILTDDSLPTIGNSFGGKDHTTVLHAYKKIKKEVESDNNISKDVKFIIKSLKENN